MCRPTYGTYMHIALLLPFFHCLCVFVSTKQNRGNRLLSGQGRQSRGDFSRLSPPFQDQLRAENRRRKSPGRRRRRLEEKLVGLRKAQIPEKVSPETVAFSRGTFADDDERAASGASRRRSKSNFLFHSIKSVQY